MKKSYLIAPIALGASLAVVIPTHAQLIASEGFNYTPGTSMASVGTAGNGWANVWADKGNLDVLQSGSLAYTDGSGNTLATSGNSLQSNGSSTGSSSSEPQRTITGTFGTLALANPAAPDTLWMSYLWQGGNTTTASGTLFRQATLMFLKGASTTSTSPGGTEYMDIGMPNISSANVGTVSPNISLWASSGNAGQTANGAPISSLNPVQSTVPANDGNTDFILIELTGSATAWSAAGNSETMNVWINPSLTQSTPVGAPNISYSQQDLSTINAIRAQGGGLNTTYGPLPGEESVDEINIGDTAADVEPLVSPVPEPTSIALAAIGGLSLLALKRKRS
jgi:hypothetical protein